MMAAQSRVSVNVFALRPTDSFEVIRVRYTLATMLVNDLAKAVEPPPHRASHQVPRKCRQLGERCPQPR